MGIFTRFKDIVNSNLSAMLDRAEDPEKLIRLMIGEMEETLVELKASCAGLMAEQKKLARREGEARAQAGLWAERAAMAVDKGREDLAREAIVEQQAAAKRADALSGEVERFDALVDQARGDIVQLEDKLAQARERQRSLVQRQRRAQDRKRARTDADRSEAADAMLRFEKFEQRIERMEAEAEMSGPQRRGTLEDEFARLEHDESVELELARLKDSRKGQAKGKGGK
jgi:phage shock protein A